MLPGHTSSLLDVVFSPDGRNLASVSQDGYAQIWDAATGQEVLTLTSSPEQLTRVAYSPDGRRLITAGPDAMRVHLLPIDDLVSLARSRLTRWWMLEECHKLLHQELCPAQSH
jgi:WD40 repeat protein